MKTYFRLLTLFGFVFLTYSKITEPSEVLSKIFPIVIPMNNHTSFGEDSLARLGSALDTYGESVLEQKETYPLKKAKSQKEKILFAFLADLVEDDSLPCVDGNTESFQSVFHEHAKALESFSKLLQFMMKNIESVASGKPAIAVNESLSKYVLPIIKNAENLEKLSTEMRRLTSYKDKANISKANLPVSVRCRYIETRREVIDDIYKKTEDLKRIMVLAEELTDLLRAVVQFVDPEASEGVVQKVKELKKQLSYSLDTMHADIFTSKKDPTWSDLAKALPDYL